MNNLKSPIIPVKPIYYGDRKTLDLESICVFAAIGFFLDDTTFFKELKVIKPATFNEKNHNYFKWFYEPLERPLNVIVDEFAELFEKIIEEKIGKKKVILPLSGGIDSRSLATALKYLKKDVACYSYTFKNGHDETIYAKNIAEVCNFPLQSWEIPEGYLWHIIDDLAAINECYSEFTHPRQMAFINQYAALGNIFCLGHWGDVLFDNKSVDNDLSTEKQVNYIISDIVKKGGLELANELWKSWNLQGDFEEYLKSKVTKLLKEIDIPNNANAQMRAFKSTHWAPRWTAINLQIFEKEKPLILPYFDDRMCQFICSIPEKYLSGRQIQIEYIKKRMPELAKITWQAQRPYNLYNYSKNKFPRNIPYRIFHKSKQILSSKMIVQRNWELQFLGKENDLELRKHLFENKSFQQLVDPSMVEYFYDKFQKVDAVIYSHPISMLLTLSLFCKQNSFQK